MRKRTRCPRTPKAFAWYLATLAEDLAAGRTTVDRADTLETGAYLLALRMCSSPSESVEVQASDTRWREFTDPAWQAIVGSSRWR